MPPSQLPPFKQLMVSHGPETEKGTDTHQPSGPLKTTQCVNTPPPQKKISNCCLFLDGWTAGPKGCVVLGVAFPWNLIFSLFSLTPKKKNGWLLFWVSAKMAGGLLIFWGCLKRGVANFWGGVKTSNMPISRYLHLTVFPLGYPSFYSVPNHIYKTTIYIVTLTLGSKLVSV